VDDGVLVRWGPLYPDSWIDAEGVEGTHTRIGNSVTHSTQSVGWPSSSARSDRCKKSGRLGNRIHVRHCVLHSALLTAAERLDEESRRVGRQLYALVIEGLRARTKYHSDENHERVSVTVPIEAPAVALHLFREWANRHLLDEVCVLTAVKGHVSKETSFSEINAAFVRILPAGTAMDDWSVRHGRGGTRAAIPRGPIVAMPHDGAPMPACADDSRRPFRISIREMLLNENDHTSCPRCMYATHLPARGESAVGHHCHVCVCVCVCVIMCVCVTVDMAM
jgi:hypothetical protein